MSGRSRIPQGVVDKDDKAVRKDDNIIRTSVLPEVRASVLPQPVAPGSAPGSSTAGPAAGAPSSAPEVIPTLEMQVMGLKAFKETLVAAEAAVERVLLSGKGGRSVKQDHLNLLESITNLMRRKPVLVSDMTPDTIDLQAATGADMRMQAANLRTLATKLDYTGRQLEAGAWGAGSTGYKAAEARAKDDPDMETEVAPIRNALKSGPRTAQAEAKASREVSKAAKAQTRAEKSAAKAAAATRAHARAQQAAADRQAARGGYAQPPANPQGPAPSANVNPQGPAPGTGSGTGNGTGNGR